MSTDIELINDDVTINMAEVITNVTATSFSGDGSAITNIPGGSIDFFVCKSELIDAANINLTPFTNISVFKTTQDLLINVGGFSSSFSGIIIPENGLYLCMVNLKEFSDDQRTNASVKFTINGTQQKETGASGYIRNLGNHSGSSVHIDTVYNLTAGDEIGLAIGALGGGGTVSLQGSNSSVCIYRVG